MPEVDVLAIGELNPDFILSGIDAVGPRLGTEQAVGAYRLTLGSSTAIACVVMRRLGLTAAMSAWVGDDEQGRFCRAALAAEDIDTRLVREAAALPTGLTVALAYPADRLLLTCKGTMALNPAEGIDDAVLLRARHLHVGSFFLQDALRPALAPLFARAQALGLTTSLDTGWDPDEHWLNDDLRAALAHTDVLLPNRSEFERLSGEAAVELGVARLLAMGVGAVALKLGADGAAHGDAHGLVTARGLPAAAIDTTGAGDAFNAGYLAAMLHGEPPPARLAFGNACGALTVAAIGGTGGVASAEQVRARLAQSA